MTRFSTLIILAMACLYLQSCEIAGDITLIAEDLTVQFEENQELGQAIGQIKATADGAALQFEVMSADPENAFSIDRKTGLLSIADPDLFDFEARPSLTAEIKVVADDQSEIVDVLVELEDALAPIEDWNRITKFWETKSFELNQETKACRMDDRLSVSGTGKYTYETGSVFCEEPEMLWLANGSWDLDENLQFIIFDKGTASEFKADIEVFENGVLSLHTIWAGAEVKVAFQSN